MATSGQTFMGKLPSKLIKLMGFEFDEDLKNFWGFKQELNLLQKSVVSITNLVPDAEEKQRPDINVRDWLRNVKEVAYHIDDLLSDLAYETTRLRILNQEVSIYLCTIS
ncbi:NB-ARC domain-containing disease resistance protein [Euphorbia peplus]|nr:NB-ARC domain-containing disease resistance protein [Euphorbia peplus]